jgi:putative endonuclease
LIWLESGMALQKFFLYILQSQKDVRYYVGISKDIKTRLDQHNRGVGKFTRSKRPWRLMYTEEYNTRPEAARREKQIKNQKSRSYIESLIRSHVSEWERTIIE